MVLGKEYQVYRNVCPRNCFCTCSMLSYVRHGRLEKVAGDPLHGFTRGRLCAKGYAYVQRVYAPERVVFPLRQEPRGSGNWRRISWTEALDIIARKILEIKGRYDSLWPIALYVHYGHLGLLHLAVEGFFDALGFITKIQGNLCWSAGLEANLLDMGRNLQPDPETMANVRSIIIWGANPAWTALHQMHFIDAARRLGALVVVIDPLITATAAQADLHIQVNPGGDGALALGVAKYLVEKGWYEKDFAKKYLLGWEEFKSYLQNKIKYTDICRVAGVDQASIEELAKILVEHRPVALWKGMGLQRYTNGGQNIRAINALAALAGCLGSSGGGLYYASLQTWDLFNFHARNWSPPPGVKGEHRYLPITRAGEGLLAAQEPPVKFLWIARANPLSQAPDPAALQQAMSNMELVVLVDQFLTSTSQYADLFLPCTTQFEEWEIIPSYWHWWVAINQQAISPVGESKSDLEIAWNLSARLNELSPGSCNFPTGGDEEEWVAAEFNPYVYQLLGIKDYRELLQGPRKLKMPERGGEPSFATPSRKYELFSAKARQAGLPAIPVLATPLSPPPPYPFRLLTPYLQGGNNSQFLNLPWLMSGSWEPVLRVHPAIADKLSLKSGDLVRVYNDRGELVLPVLVTQRVPPQVVVCYQGGTGGKINRLLGGVETDLGKEGAGAPAPAYFETFVNIARV